MTNPKDTTHIYWLELPSYYVLVTLAIELVFENYIFVDYNWSGLYGKILYGWYNPVQP